QGAEGFVQIRACVQGCTGYQGHGHGREYGVLVVPQQPRNTGYPVLGHVAQCQGLGSGSVAFVGPVQLQTDGALGAVPAVDPVVTTSRDGGQPQVGQRSVKAVRLVLMDPAQLIQHVDRASHGQELSSRWASTVEGNAGRKGTKAA